MGLGYQNAAPAVPAASLEHRDLTLGIVEIQINRVRVIGLGGGFS